MKKRTSQSTPTILSIDWDFFVNAKENYRAHMFPDGGNENLPESILNYIWERYYEIPIEELKRANFPSLEGIGVIPDEYDLIKRLLRETRSVRSFRVFDSHKHMYDMVNALYPDKQQRIKVINVDYHHDLFSYRTMNEKVNCGNWATELRAERPNLDYWWVKREDSDENVLGGKVDAHTLDESGIKSLYASKDQIDHIFICRSGVWSPPHLDPAFIELYKTFIDRKDIDCACTIQSSVTTPRKYGGRYV